MRRRGHKGYSTVEILCFIGYGLLALCLIFYFFVWNRRQANTGNDALRENTALSVGRANMSASGCVVNDCSGGQCAHARTGIHVGYFNPTGNTIVATKPSGYNEGKSMTIDGTTYYGNRKTMVLEVTGDDTTNEVTIRWVVSG